MIAYIDPSVMTYTIQIVAGIAIAIGAFITVYFRKAKKKVVNKLGIDENKNKEVESDEIVVNTKSEVKPVVVDSTPVVKKTATKKPAAKKTTTKKTTTKKETTKKTTTEKKPTTKKTAVKKPVAKETTATKKTTTAKKTVAKKTTSKKTATKKPTAKKSK